MKTRPAWAVTVKCESLLQSEPLESASESVCISEWKDVRSVWKGWVREREREGKRERERRQLHWRPDASYGELRHLELRISGNTIWSFSALRGSALCPKPFFLTIVAATLLLALSLSYCLSPLLASYAVTSSAHLLCDFATGTRDHAEKELMSLFAGNDRSYPKKLEYQVEVVSF